METPAQQSETVMSAAALAGLRSPLLRIGSHSLDHPRMAELSPAEQARQAGDSRRALEDLCGTNIDEFAFPYGSINPAALQAVQAAGYRHAYTVMPQRVAPAEPGDDEALFRLKMTGAFAWLPLASRAKQALRARRWRD